MEHGGSGPFAPSVHGLRWNELGTDLPVTRGKERTRLSLVARMTARVERVLDDGDSPGSRPKTPYWQLCEEEWIQGEVMRVAIQAGPETCGGRSPAARAGVEHLA
jgi:hypothetical protein